MNALSDTPLRGPAQQVLKDWQVLSQQRRLYTILGVALILAGLGWSIWFADANNAGHFFDRLPHLFDFLSWLIPSDWSDVWRALFDLPSPQDNGSEQFNFVLGRVYLWGDFYLPEYFYLMLVTINVALVSTIVGFIGGIALCFVAARNYSPSNWLRLPVKRVMELFRAFPEIVIAGMFAAIISIGPVAAIIAISIHCIGALTKLFYETVENVDMGPDEGLQAVGANWVQRVRFGALPQALPNFLSYALLRLEINVRASTIIGAVGAVGIGQELKLSISRGFGAKTLALVLLLFVTIFIVDQFSAWLRRKLVGEQAFLMQGVGK
ncbi:MAG TPA: phosphonate ABC transporter, permease protein PhnE [Devosiaceae bacterium]|jgi:phosphonate transport system permease protein